MDIQKFDPMGKSFHFRLNEYSCYKCSTGICSLESISLDELKNSESCVGAIGESSIQYCRGMAKLFIDDEFTTPARIQLNTQCGHYTFSDGQHRTCVVARILKKDAKVVLNAEVVEQDCLCRDCLMKAHFEEKESSISKIDKMLKTKKYRNLKQSKEDYDKHEFIYTFDN